MWLMLHLLLDAFDSIDQSESIWSKASKVINNESRPLSCVDNHWSISLFACKMADFESFWQGGTPEETIISTTEILFPEFGPDCWLYKLNPFPVWCSRKWFDYSARHSNTHTHKHHGEKNVVTSSSTILEFWFADLDLLSKQLLNT